MKTSFGSMNISKKTHTPKTPPQNKNPEPLRTWNILWLLSVLSDLEAERGFLLLLQFRKPEHNTRENMALVILPN